MHNRLTAEQIFHEAREMAPAEQAAYLKGACGVDLALRNKVETLLRADAEAGVFLREAPMAGSAAGVPVDATDVGRDATVPHPDGRDATVPHPGAPDATVPHPDGRDATVPHPDGPDATIPHPGPGRESDSDPGRRARPSEQSGQLIGRYKLLQRIGEGGFGSVWMAEQREPVRRRVALKIIKLGMDTRQVIARFEAERQALAMMDHPNIAKVLDAGSTDTGRPYFVMEYIRGVPILDYCDAEKLDTRRRLELFMSVCHAIQHAHQKGIIHRDVKPSNVLITLHDGLPVPKVIDFGIAKATNSELTQKTLFTEHGQMIGTPAYMSPEQAEMSGLDIDTRSDIYSLGVLLYELLTGTTPFDAKDLLGRGLAEMLRIIREVEPHKPSTRLSSLGETATRTAQQRRSDTRKLGLLLRGDLDWITMKCLEKDRSRRYETANGLVADVQRYLTGEAVCAAPPSVTYRVRKFVRRHRGPVVAASLVAGALVLGIVGTTTGMIWADEQRRVAQRQRQAAELAQRAEELEKQRAVAAELEATRQRQEADHLRTIAEFQAYTNSITAASAALRNPGYGDVYRRLQMTPEAFRHWEWHYANALLNREFLVLRPHSDSVLYATFSSDNRRILTGGGDGAVEVFDAVTGERVGSLIGHRDQVWMTRFSHDGTRVVTAGEDATARVWDAETGVELLTLAGHGAGLYSAVFSPDDTRVLTVCDDRVARVFDAVSGAELLSLTGHTKEVVAGIFTSDGTRIITSSWDDTTIMWDARNGELVAQLQGRLDHREYAAVSDDSTRLVTVVRNQRADVWDCHTGEKLFELHEGMEPARAARMRPDGQAVAIGNVDGTVTLWSLPDGRTIRLSSGGPPAFCSFAFSSDSRRLAVTSNLEMLKIFDAESGALLESFAGEAATPEWQEFSPDGSRFISPGSDGTVRVWESTSTPQMRVLSGHDGYVGSVAFSPDGKQLITACEDGALRFWNTSDGAAVATLRHHSSSVRSVAYVVDGDQIITASYDRTAAILDAATGEPVRTFRGHTEEVRTAFVSPDSRHALTASNDDTARVWDLASGATVHILVGHTGDVFSALFNPDGTMIVSVSADGRAKIWDASTAANLLTIDGHDGEPVRWGCYSPDGARIATASDDATCKIWDATTGAHVATLSHWKPVRFVTYSADGERILTGSDDGGLRIWEAQNGVPIDVLADHRDSVLGAEFSPDGTLLATVSADGTAIIYDSLDRRTRLSKSHPEARFSDEISRVLDSYLERAANENGRGSAHSYERADYVQAASLIRRDSLLGSERRRAVLAYLLRCLSEYQEQLNKSAMGYVRQVDQRLILREDIVSEIEADSTLGGDLRATALRLARATDQSAGTLNTRAWYLVRFAGGTDADYARGLRAAQLATSKESDNWFYVHTLGVAQYRSGQYEAAIGTFQRCEDLFDGRDGHTRFAILVFVAMSQHHLGRQQAANATYELARTTLSDDGARDDEYEAWRIEADSLIEGVPAAMAPAPATQLNQP